MPESYYIMILLSEMENLFAQLIVSPAATEQRQIDVALSLSNVERQTG